ncbi:MAG: phosphoribosylformylglycinamidine synthase subunit PurQ [Alphaproteobacteria bacterium]|nr:phosphoribosylformylglycinamidine synthase subunit PurQ [Alphaproteobacteria bacterium]
MKAAVIVFPASNCDRDIQVALRQSMGEEPIMVWHREGTLPKVDLIVLPGGFSYGDYLRAGAMAAHSPIMREVVARAGRGVPVLGVCNGFQILAEAGLLPGVLMRNATLKFVCRDVHLKVEAANSIFTGGYRPQQVLRIPIAHADGNYFADDRTLDELEDEGRIAFRYCEPDGRISSEANPNGAQRNIAGIFNKDRNVLGLMPHPERAADPALGNTDGRALFDHLVASLGP